MLKTFFSLDPITILSGNLKSRIASPSLKNSGFETSVNNFLFFLSNFSILSPVPTGTVDLVTMIFLFFEYFNISFTHWLIKDKSTSNVPFFVGVPTQMKIISDAFIAFFTLFVNESLLAKKFFLINSSKPGS